MNRTQAYRYVFAPQLALEDVQGSLLLAVLAAECLHGQEQVLLDARQVARPESRWWILDASTSTGRDLNRLFAGFLRREFTPGSFRVEPVNAVSQPWQPLGMDSIAKVVSGSVE